MSTKQIATVLVVVVLVILGVSFIPKGGSTKYNAFAQCLADKKAVFYGAFWCPHCQNQKRMFKAAQKLLPYVECSTPDGKGTLPVCTEKGVKTYPTWIFENGETLTGEIALEVLAEKTGCALPVEE